MNKKLFFLVATPRSGNTLFASIINQNPEIVCTANSITLEIMKDILFLKQSDIFINFPDHNSLDNVLDSVYDSYYKNWPQKYIIDRGPATLSSNFELLNKHYRRPFKCIILVRDLIDIFASFIKWYKQNPSSFVNSLGNTDEEKLTRLMNKEGIIAKNLEAIKNSFNYPEICYFIKYNDIVSNPEKTFNDLYKFLEIKPFKHNFQNLKQLEINNIGYNDKVFGKNMHTIKTKIVKEINPYLKDVPESLIKKYGHIKF